jgi:hypothetical protein
MGAVAGKFDRSSTAITCLLAPMAKRVSVALGESEIIREGFAACDGVTSTTLTNAAIEKVATSREALLCKILNIKKLPQIFEGGSWAEEFSQARPSSEVGYFSNSLGDLT